MLSFHEKTGLKEIKEFSFSAARVGIYIGDRVGSDGKVIWKLCVKRRTKGSTWKVVHQDDLPKRLKVEAMIFCIHI